MAPKGIKKTIKEYSVLIDSKDRNYKVYRNPFQYTTTFWYGNSRIDAPTPNVDTKLENVKYIKLDTAILPLYTSIKQVPNPRAYMYNDKEVIWNIDTKTLTTDNNYIVLSIDGYNDTQCCSTNNVFNESFAVLYYDKLISNTHYITRPSNGHKEFKQPTTINRLNISFMNPYGMPLDCPHFTSDIYPAQQGICVCDNSDPSKTTYDYDPMCTIHNLHHPWNGIFQHHLHFKVGVEEYQFND